MPVHASELYSKNVLALLRTMFDRENNFSIDLEDEVLAGCILTHEGAVRHQPTRELMEKTGSPA